MFKRKPKTADAGQLPPRVVAIIARQQVVELWHIHRMRTNFKEREIDLPQEVQSKVVNGRRERRHVHRRQLSRQEWGHFIIRRYQATRMLPWTPSLGLMLLIPGTLLAAGSANQGISQVPVSVLVVQWALITIGGLLAIASGWRILTRRLCFTDGASLESLGVSSHALGFPAGVVAADSFPHGYRPGRFRGSIAIEAPVGPWNIVEEYADDAGWHRRR